MVPEPKVTFRHDFGLRIVYPVKFPIIRDHFTGTGCGFKKEISVRSTLLSKTKNDISRFSVKH